MKVIDKADTRTCLHVSTLLGVASVSRKRESEKERERESVNGLNSG